MKNRLTGFRAWLRESARAPRRLRWAALGLVLLPPTLLFGEAAARAHLSPVMEGPAATRVYGRPLVLDRGARPERAWVEEHLQRVGYRRVRGGEVGIGEYYLGSRGWVIGRRPFRSPGAAGEAHAAGAQKGGADRGPDPASNPPRDRATGSPPHAGAEWARDLTPGGFVVVRLDHSGRISRLEDGEGRRMNRAFLEPELVGRVSGGSDEDRLPVRLEDVPEDLIAALLTVEDQRFFQHQGLDPRRIAAAAAANLRVGRVVQGGSTLTQQLAKNLYLSPRRSLDRKLREAAMALTLELRHSKEEILEAYLNEVYLGQDRAVGILGVGTAAEFFFGKDVGSLRLEESALLVALIRAPSLYSPIRNPEVARERRDLVLGLMRERELVSEEEYREAVDAPLEIRRRAEPIRSARYFLDYVHAGMNPREALDRGEPLVTTLDPRLQRVAEKAVTDGLSRLERDFAWLREGEGGRPLQAALVALDPRTGEILAMVGGRDYGRSQFNRAVGARRQPGSAFKPVVALAALARPEDPSGADGALPRFTLASVLDDAPLHVETRVGLWEPANYDGGFSGPVTLRDALERSLNVPFARLGLAVGPERIVETARSLGIESALRAYPSLALGAGEVTPLELTRAFGVLAAGGFRADLRAEYSGPAPDPFGASGWTEGAWGAPVSPNSWGAGSGIPGRQVYDPAESYLVTSALRGAVERGTGRSLRTLGFLGDVAAKSGTTNDFRDGWFVGYTPALVVGVWVGFDQGKPLELPGAGVALPIFADFLKGSVGQYGDQGPWGTDGFALPPGLERVEVDPETGLRGGWGCRGEAELFLSGTAPLGSCSEFHFDGRTFQRIVGGGGEEAIRLLRRLLGRGGGETDRR